MPAQPDLPQSTPELEDSMLTRKFGLEVQNYFSGSPLNRLSFLRTDHAFLSAAITHPSTAFVAVDDLAPAARDASHLAFVNHDDLRSVIGDNPFAKTEAEALAEFNSTVRAPVVLFLGLDDKKQEGFEYKAYKGVPYFAVDITPKGAVEEASKGVIEALKAKGLIFLQGRSAMTLNAGDGTSSLPYHIILPRGSY
jgi:NAD+ diphosphatase